MEHCTSPHDPSQVHRRRPGTLGDWVQTRLYLFGDLMKGQGAVLPTGKAQGRRDAHGNPEEELGSQICMQGRQDKHRSAFLLLHESMRQNVD